jgi:exodeoxyribonuclease-3
MPDRSLITARASGCPARERTRALDPINARRTAPIHDDGRHRRCTPTFCLASHTSLQVLSLNIGAAAVPRAKAILSWLRSRSEDVFVLTETSRGKGTRLLLDGLRARGYSTFSTVETPDRGVAVASRIPIHDVLDSQLSLTLPWRASGVVLDTRPRVSLIGVYVPSRDRTPVKVARKEAFLASLLQSVRGLTSGLRSRLLVVGDYNAVARRHNPPIPGFFPYEYAFHEELEGLGLKAAHELRGESVQPHSWIGRTGNGYLYDYVHVGKALQSSVERCSYLHGPRERRLTDHAAVTVRLRLG